MQIVVIAGGLATRLGDLVKDKPKSLLEIAGKPFLEHQLEFVAKCGGTEVVYCLGHLGNQIQDYVGSGKRFGLKIQYSVEDRPLGTAGALKNAEPLLNDIFYTLYGDSYLFLDIIAIGNYFKSQNKLALMTVYQNHDCYDCSNCSIEGDLVCNYSKAEKNPAMTYIDYVASLFRKEVLSFIPNGCFYSLESLLCQLTQKKELLAYEVKERFYEIGSINGIKEFTDYVLAKK